MRWVSLVLILGLWGCRGCKSSVSADTGDTDTDVIIDTEIPPDTGDTAETGDTGIAPTWTEVHLSPPFLYTTPNSQIAYRLVGTSPEGWRGDPRDLGLELSVEADAALVSWEGLTATTLAAGSTPVTLEWEGGVAQATLVIADEGELQVGVVDALTGTPLVGATVLLGDEVQGQCCTSGVLYVQEGVPDGPIDVTASAEGYVTTTLSGVVGRHVVIPLRPDEEAIPSVVQGTADLSALDPDPSQMAVGLVGVDLPADPWFYQPASLTAPARAVTIFGVDTELPANLVVQDHVATWEIEAPSGQRHPWGVAVTLPLADALAAGAGGTDPLVLLSDNLSSARWQLLDPLTPPDQGLFAPVDPLEWSTEVVVPELPAGLAGDEAPLVLPLVAEGEGWVPVGLGAGQGTLQVEHLSEPEQWLVLAQAGGLGSGGGTTLSLGAPDALPPFTDVPPLPVVYVESRQVGLSTDTDAQLVLATVADRQGDQRDLIAPVGALRAGLPSIQADIQRGRTTWSLWVVSTESTTLEELAASGVLTPTRLEGQVTGTAQVHGEVAGTAE